MIIARLNGKNLFHVRYIKLSYRIRGKVARIHTNKVAIIIVLATSWRSGKIIIDPENKVTVRSLINRMLAYSAMKMSANIPALYSTLNPETNSDSPSAKSNGVRLVSAKFVINHITNRGVIIIEAQNHEEASIILRFIDLWRINADSKIRAIDTSYEIVWATPRRAPNRAYFELEHHPAMKVVYTFILDTHKKNKIPYVR